MAPMLPPFNAGHINVMVKIIAKYDQDRPSSFVGSDQYKEQEAVEVLEMVRREWKESHNDQEWADIQKFGPEAMGNVFFDPHGPKPNGRDACFDALVRHRRAWGNLSDSEKLKAQCLDLDGNPVPASDD